MKKQYTRTCKRGVQIYVFNYWIGDILLLVFLIFQNRSITNVSKIFKMIYGKMLPLLSEGFTANICKNKFHAKWYVIVDIILLSVQRIKKL